MYDKLCVNARSMPFWCVANPLSDPFGGAVDICVELASRLKSAKKSLNDTEAELAAIRQLCKI